MTCLTCLYTYGLNHRSKILNLGVWPLHYGSGINSARTSTVPAVLAVGQFIQNRAAKFLVQVLQKLCFKCEIILTCPCLWQEKPMLFFAHAGITTAIARLSQMLVRADSPSNKEGHLALPSNTVIRARHVLLDNLCDKMREIDYRFVLLGSLLPDIIDKPLWMFTSLHWDGRGYAHTFIFNFVLLLSGVVVLKQFRQMWLLILSLCSFIHLVLDQMWANPTTLWWPLLGPIPRGETAGWFSSLWNGLFSSPVVYISETIGFLIAVYVAFRTISSGRLLYFLKTGDLFGMSKRPES